MRTTLSIDDEVLRLARQRAEIGGRPLGEVINKALRRGLAEEPLRRVSASTVVYGDVSDAIMDDARLSAWSQQLDAAEAARKLAP